MRHTFSLFLLISFLAGQHFALSQCDTPTDDIFYASRSGDLEKVKKLIEGGIDINGEDAVGGTALFYAVQRNHNDIAELLIRSGADVNHRSPKGGYTALMAIHGKDNSESLQLLLDHGADINLKDNESKTAFLRASEYCNPPVIKLFIDHGANISDTDANGENAIVRCLNSPPYEQQNQLSAIETLVSAGVDVNHQDPYGHSAAYRAFNSRKLDVIRLIAPKVQGKFWKDAVLDFRAAMNNPELLQLYLDAGAEVNAGQELGWNFLTDAARLGTLQSVEVLIQAGANVNSTNIDGASAIDYAVYKDDAAMVHFLISQGANIEDTKNDFLKKALLAGHFDTAKVLEDAGAHVENQRELTLKGQLTQFVHHDNKEGAEQIFQTLEKEFPDADRRAEIFQLGAIYFRQELYQQSIDLHKQIIRLYPNSISVLSAYYQIAQAYRKLDLGSSVAQAYQDLLSYPDTDNNPSPYDIINVREIAKEEVAFYHIKINN